MNKKKKYPLYKKDNRTYYYTLEKTYETEDKMAYIKIHTDLGFFEGRAFFNPNDEYSSFLGYEIAESRAQIEFFKKKISLLRLQFSEVSHIQSQIKKMKPLKRMTRKERKIYKIINNEIEKIEEEISTYKNIVEEIKKENNEKINTRISLLEKKRKIKE